MKARILSEKGVMINKMYDLNFDPQTYGIKTCEIGNKKVTYRAFENIVYCAKPVSSRMLLAWRKNQWL